MPELDDDTRALVARHLGMKRAEVVAVVELDDAGMVVEDHTGYRVLITPDGTVHPWDGSMPGDSSDAGEVEDLEDAEVDGDGSGEPNGDGVPSGTADEVLAWVGEDRERAAQALAAEQGRDKPRTGLTAQLEKLAGLA